MDRYNFKSAEDKWQKIWEESKPYKTNVNHKKKKFYCLEMFPYPSIYTWDMFEIIQLEMF